MSRIAIAAVNLVAVPAAIMVTERQLEMMESLRSMDSSWLRPMDIGGTDGSYHSKTLAQLVRKGLVERLDAGGHTRAVWRYRATSAGRSARLVSA